MRIPSGAEARLILGLLMYGLKPVPFTLKPVPFTLKSEPFTLKPEPFAQEPMGDGEHCQV